MTEKKQIGSQLFEAGAPFIKLDRLVWKKRRNHKHSDSAESSFL